MIFRRLSSALKRQDWVTVFIEFVLVIAGVLIALQVNNWNEERGNKQGVINTLTRLHSEAELNIAVLEERITDIEESKDVRLAAIGALQACDPSPEALLLLGEVASELSGDILPSLVDRSLSELARQDKFLALLSNDFRTEINKYDSALSDERDQLQTNFNLMWDQHIISNPNTDMETSDDSVFSATVVFRQPMNVLCADPVFRRQFLMTDIWHNSAAFRMQSFKEESEDFLTQIKQELEFLQ